MKRRNFLQLTSWLVAASIYGCGDEQSTIQGGLSNPTSSAGSNSVQVTGRIAPEISVRSPNISSSFGPTTVLGDTFTTSVSLDTVSVLTMTDQVHSVRGFALTFPNQSALFSFEETAIAIIFMEPGFLKLQVDEARSLIESIKASPQFSSFVSVLRTDTPLEVLSVQPNYLRALNALVESLPSPFPPASDPDIVVTESTVTITNPSIRFLSVIRTDANGETVLDELVPPYGSLADTPTNLDEILSYQAVGLGRGNSGSSHLDSVRDTFGPTSFFVQLLPLLELALGAQIPVDIGLVLFQDLDNAYVPSDSVLTSDDPAVLAGALQEDTQGLGGVASVITKNFACITNKITGGSYLAGVAFAIAAIMKFKQHTDDPQPVPVGVPIADVIEALEEAAESILSSMGTKQLGLQ